MTMRFESWVACTDAWGKNKTDLAHHSRAPHEQQSWRAATASLLLAWPPRPPQTQKPSRSGPTLTSPRSTPCAAGGDSCW
eukprot:3803746-Pleurochrysis_carterae.AAC.1